MYLKLFIIIFILTYTMNLEASIKSDIQTYETRLNELQKGLLSSAEPSSLEASSLILAQQSEKIIRGLF